MRLKPKTVRRLLLLSVALLMLVGAGVAVVVVRKARTESRLVARREAGFEAAAAGNHAKVVNELGAYLKRRPMDPESLLAWARARRFVEARDGKHLIESASVYQRYLTLQPDDKTAREELLECLSDAGLDVEVIDVARQLRPSDPTLLTREHLPYIRHEIDAHRLRREYDLATVLLAQRAIALDPADFGMRIRYGAMLAATKRTEDAEDFVASCESLFPGDPRVELVRVVSGQPTLLTPEETLKSLAAIVGVDPVTGARTGPPLDNDEAVLTMVVSAFSHLGRTDLTLSALEPRAREGDKDAARTFARRALYAGEYDRLIDTQASLPDVPTWNTPDMIGLAGLALAAKGRHDEARAKLQGISEAGDYRGRSWALAREAMLVERETPLLSDVKALRDAVEENPIEPLFRARLATLLLELGRTEEARQQLAAAARSPLAEGWPRIGVLEARTYLAEGRLLEARKACEQTLAEYPADPAATALMLSIRIEMLDRRLSDGMDTRVIAERLGPTLDALSEEGASSIPADLRVMLIAGVAVAAQTNGDVETARRAVDLAARSELTFPGPLLARLAMISRAHSFDLESTLISQAERKGPTPASVHVRALLLDSESKRQEAIELIRREAGVGDRAAATEWRLLLPAFLDEVGDAGAAGAWREALKAAPDDVDAHRAALASRGVATDMALVNEISGRLEDLTGTKGERAPMLVRIARARAMASAPDASANRDQLIGLLRAIVTEAPDLEEPHVLLVNALLADTPITTANAITNEAINNLRAASTVSANPAPYRLRVAEILRRVGNPTAARAELVTVASDGSSDIESRWAAVEGLAGLGHFEQAATFSRNLLPADVAAVSTERLLDLGRIYTLAGDDDAARRVYTDLAKPERGLSPDQAFQVASGFAFLGEAAKGEELLLTVEAPPGEQRTLDRMRARLVRAVGDNAKARDMLNALIQSDPEDIESRCLLIESYISDGATTEARAAIEDARKGRPPHPDVELLAMQLQFRGNEGSAASLESLADILDQKPEFKERARAVRAYAALRTKQERPNPAALRELAHQFADEPSLQSVIVSDLLACEPPAIGIASEVSLQAARRFPASWQIASDVVRAHTMAGNWAEVLTAAERWQRLNRSREADLAIGEAQLQLGRPRLARNAVQPHVAGAIAAPDTSIPTLRLWCSVLIAERQVEEARTLLEPHLATSASILDRVWIHLAAYNLAPETAVAWLRAAAAPAAAHGPDSRYALANAWFELALRDEPKAKAHLVEARTILDALAADSRSPAAMILLGRVCGHMQDYDSARSAFVAAAEHPEAKAEALRGLALIAITSGADPGVAVAAARRAVEASAPNEPMSMRLLGDALIAAAEAEPDPAKHRPLATEAAGLYKGILGISGESLLVLDRMARAYTRAGDVDLAIEAYERLMALPAGAMSAQQLAATQNNFACALLTKTDTDSLTHARQLALAASGVLPVGAVFDTLGAAEAALGNKVAAVDAFRQSLKLRPEAAGTAVKLAELLAPGTDSQREEARKLVAQTDAAIANSPAVLTPDLLERFNRVRGVLGSN